MCIYKFIYIYIYLGSLQVDFLYVEAERNKYLKKKRRKKDATTFSQQACFVNRFTLHSLIKPLKSEAIHETGLSGKCSCVLFSS